MCSLTSYDLLDMADQAVWYQTPHMWRNRPKVLCNHFNAYDVEEADLGEFLHSAIQTLNTNDPMLSLQDRLLAKAESILEECYVLVD